MAAALRISDECVGRTVDFPARVDAFINELSDANVIVAFIACNLCRGYSQHYAVLALYRLIKAGRITKAFIDDEIKLGTKFAPYTQELFDHINAMTPEVAYAAVGKTQYGVSLCEVGPPPVIMMGDAADAWWRSTLMFF